MKISDSTVALSSIKKSMTTPCLSSIAQPVWLSTNELKFVHGRVLYQQVRLVQEVVKLNLYREADSAVLINLVSTLIVKTADGSSPVTIWVNDNHPQFFREKSRSKNRFLRNFFLQTKNRIELFY